MFEGGYVSANVLPLITFTCDRYWFVGNGERLLLRTYVLSTRRENVLRQQW